MTTFMGLIRLTEGMSSGDGSVALPFSDDFNRANGALASPWLGSAYYNIVSNQAVGAPPPGGEDVSNGNMETGSPPTGWTGIGGGVLLASVADERTGGAGTKSLSVKANSVTAFCYAVQTLQSPAGTWVVGTGWFKRVNATGWRFRLLTSAFGDIALTSGTETDWTQATLVAQLPSADAKIMTGNDSNTIGHDMQADDLSLKPLTLADQIKVVLAPSADVTAGVNAYLAAQHAGGVVLSCDDPANPQNMVVVVYSRTLGKLLMRKMVNGVWAADIISQAVAYSDGAQVKGEKSGTTYKAYYADTQLGGNKTISDATIIDNKYDGILTTGGGSAFDGFFLL